MNYDCLHHILRFLKPQDLQFLFETNNSYLMTCVTSSQYYCLNFLTENLQYEKKTLNFKSAQFISPISYTSFGLLNLCKLPNPFSRKTLLKKYSKGPRLILFPSSYEINEINKIHISSLLFWNNWLCNVNWLVKINKHGEITQILKYPFL